MVGVEVIFDPEAVGDGAGVLIEAVLESGNASAEIIGGGMAVMIGDILPEPAPESFDRRIIQTRSPFQKSQIHPRLRLRRGRRHG